jgi:hypothetical protein
MLGFLARTLLLCAVIAFPLALVAHDAYQPNAAWYKAQKMNPKAQVRLGVFYDSCCDAGDHYQTRFRVVEDGSKYGAETYEYWKNDQWRVVPADIIQRKPTPDGKPVLFISKHDGRELCFIIDRPGI